MKHKLKEEKKTQMSIRGPNYRTPAQHSLAFRPIDEFTITHLGGSGTIQVDELKHNNMMPHFGTHVTQVPHTTDTSSRLSTFTGQGTFAHKREARALFEPQSYRGNAFGTPEAMSQMASYVVPSSYHQNVSPVEKIYVGPGLGQGFTATPSGGFHQDPREFIMPKTIDELRPVTRPQISYEGRVVQGKSSVDKRAATPAVYKNRPDRSFKQDASRYLVTTGALLKRRRDPDEIIVPDTQRQTTLEGYTGIAEDQLHTAPMDRSGEYELMPTRRETTESHTHLLNFASVVKALVAPITDAVRPTKKEEVESNVKWGGHINAVQSMSKNRPWDPNDILRTTIKETLLSGDPTYMNISGAIRLPVFDPNEVLKTTMKETMIDNTRAGNLDTLDMGLGYLTTTVEAPTTLKETLIDDTRAGNLDTLEGATGYMTNPQTAPTTGKETTLYDYSGNPQREVRNMGYTITQSTETAPHTNRQFDQDNEYLANAEYDMGMGYATQNPDARETNRQFTSDVEYLGAAISMYKQPPSDEKYKNMRTNFWREGTLVSREPTTCNVSLTVGKEDITVDQPRKLEVDRINSYVPNISNIVSQPPSMSPCALTQERQDDNDASLLRQRLDASLYDALKSNPYA
jgi:hypothetical protein